MILIYLNVFGVKLGVTSEMELNFTSYMWPADPSFKDIEKILALVDGGC